MKNFRKAVLFILAAAATPAGAQTVNSYIYSYWEKPVPAPAAYTAEAVLTGDSIGAGRFSAPEDLFVSEDGFLYVADTGNDRIVKLDRNLRFVRSFEHFTTPHGPDRFDDPTGVFVTGDGLIYTADSKNRRIVVLDPDGGWHATIGAPVSDVLRPEYSYLPGKLVVDRAGRVYVVGPGMFEGIMEFDQDGTFAGFLGSNRVTFRLGDWIWKQILTREQRGGMTLFIPEEFSNLDIDPQGFIYSTTRSEDAKHPVKKHNAQGMDVLKREGATLPAGDIAYNEVGTIIGPSSFVDVSVDENGVYHCLDAKRGRVFTYDGEGNLLSVFGGPGDQLGLFNNAVSIEVLDGRILVLDKGLARITVFEPSEYGMLVREAIKRHETGDYDAAAELWNRVLELNANFDLAYTGLGKIMLRAKEYAPAMENFRLGNDRRYYSKAFQHRRKEFLRVSFGYGMSGILLAAGAAAVFRRLRRGRKRDRLEYAGENLPFHKRLRFGLYILRHPYDGFWDLKFARIGTMGSATALLVLYILISVLQVQFTGFLFNTTVLSTFNPVEEILLAVLPILLFTLGNWSLTSLMDGEGSMKDIYISVCYALTPMILIYPAVTILSNFITIEEGAFFSFFRTFALVWTGALIFTGNQTIHNYTVKKTVGMLLLTLVAIGVILFLSLLFAAFVEQVWSFLYSIYREVVFRM